MPTRIGKYTLQMDKSPGILGFASIAGKKEKEGPLGAFLTSAIRTTPWEM